jgi:urease accessory protein
MEATILKLNTAPLKCTVPLAVGVAMAGVVLSSPAVAHITDASGAGFADGISHPFSGLDHILAMVTVGLWASQLGRPAYWVLPLTFPLLMATGALLSIAGLPLPWVEIGIAASVIFLGLMVALAVKPSLAVSIALIGLFALMHGHSHGTELPQAASPLDYGAGFLIATVVLHAIGLAIGGVSRWPLAKIGLRTAGAIIAAVGIVLLISA